MQKQLIIFFQFLEYQIESPEKFEIITYVNQNPNIYKKIFNSQYETRICRTFPLCLPEMKSEDYIHLKNINNRRKSIRKYSQEALSYSDLSDFLSIFYSR
ncbi:hypothetical protein SAMN05443429_10256 [Cruoricaptor ignavus]|uniref:Uncharacterized protein n=1 Tax=Cruoricaptor ignavus TaxID=1118202 RepID=A0A1M6BMA7_9FLAO|nr:hypothetical protein SAMN05443429_10256 [Cruoricaptor ignavus]